jgi:hypothetical protein
VSIAVKYNLREKGLDPDHIPDVVRRAFDDVLAGRPAPRASAETPADEESSADDEAAAPPAVSAPGVDDTVPVAAVAEEPPPPRVVVSRYTESLNPPAADQPQPETGMVSEELLHRSIESNVALAEVLAGLVRELNLGLGTILSRADLLLGNTDEARLKRAAGIAFIQQEAERLRALVKELGTAAAESTARGTGPIAVPSMAAEDGGFERFVRDVVASARGALDARRVSVGLHVPPGLAPPTCPPVALQRALAGTFEGLAGVAEPGSEVFVRCERKPVLLRGRDGEVRREFVMVALAHNGTLTAEDQEKIVQGQDSGPLGTASRLFREMGGFLRFATLPGGAVEARVFLPTN